MLQPVLLSIKPRFADAILAGEKQIEFRKRIFPNAVNRPCIIYSTTPGCAVVGGFEVYAENYGKISSLWKRLGPRSGIDKTDFDKYFQTSAYIYALEIRDVWKYETPLQGSEIPNWTIPQSWRYVRCDELEFLKGRKMIGEKTLANRDEHSWVTLLKGAELLCVKKLPRVCERVRDFRENKHPCPPIDIVYLSKIKRVASRILRQPVPNQKKGIPHGTQMSPWLEFKRVARERGCSLFFSKKSVCGIWKLELEVNVVSEMALERGY